MAELEAVSSAREFRPARGLEDFGQLVALRFEDFGQLFLRNSALLEARAECCGVSPSREIVKQPLLHRLLKT